MNLRILGIGVLALLTATGAKASTYFDTIDNNTGLNKGYDGTSDSLLNSASPIAQSFYVPPGSPDFSSVTLSLSADNPNDTGSVLVYLVPDDNSGALGTSGYPLVNGNATGYLGAALLGTVRDSSLTASATGPTMVTLPVSPTEISSVAAASQAYQTPFDDEYWLGVAFSAGSSGEWWYDSNLSGTGLANQSLFNVVASPTGDVTSLQDAQFAYQATISTPEPGTIAILGAGLVGLGYVRRCLAKKV